MSYADTRPAELRPIPDRTAGARVLHACFSILVAFPYACFCGALATDLAYADTADMLWADFSAWLLAAGMLLGVVAGIVGLVDMAVARRLGDRRRRWPYALGYLVMLALAAINNLVHSRDAWTSVMPEGLILSALTVLVILVTAWLGTAALPRAFPYAGRTVRP